MASSSRVSVAQSRFNSTCKHVLDSYGVSGRFGDVGFFRCCEISQAGSIVRIGKWM
jgi:hypothetical protein